MIPKSGAKFGEKLILCFKNDKNLLNFDLSTKKSKKVALWLVPFAQSIQRSTLKSTGELYFMILKSHAKFQEKLTCGLENDMRNFANFPQNTTWKCQHWYFHGILLSKVENAWATKLQGFISNDTEEWWKIWRGIDLTFQNWQKEFDEFWLENSKVSKIYTLMGCFWPKYIMFELKKYRGATFHDTRVWRKIWRKTDLWFGKWHEEFGKFSPEHAKCSKLGFHWILLYKVENEWA